MDHFKARISHSLRLYLNEELQEEPYLEEMKSYQPMGREWEDLALVLLASGKYVGLDESEVSAYLARVNDRLLKAGRNPILSLPPLPEVDMPTR